MNLSPEALLRLLAALEGVTRELGRSNDLLAAANEQREKANEHRVELVKVTAGRPDIEPDTDPMLDGCTE